MDTTALQPLQGLFLLFAFIFGLNVGSFCNVCIGRWPAGESVIKPRSRCPRCLNAIAWYDNIPLISWLVLGAKCRHCSKPISVVYPVVEALTGILFALTFWRFGFVIASPVYMLFCAAMIIVTFQDLADWTIPNEITFPGIPLGVILALAGTAWGEASGLRVTDVVDSLLGVLLGGGILLLLDRVTVYLLKKPGMGFGDVKLLAMIGAFLGWQGALGTLVIASFIGSFAGIAVIVYFKYVKKEAAAPAEKAETSEAAGDKADDEDEEITLEGHYLPFGPYLAVGALIFMFVGPELIDCYFSFLEPSGGIVLMNELTDIGF
ncbi:MAG: prepilin peptidase [Candidatus Hydrogenedens sp.]|jgi:leader peptidase (prepilin peptidase)/N-methyltransferase|nr:prepilin peptidase [Candidatus Hydrogenedens sp.]